MNYNEYFEVDKDYFPVVNPDSIQKLKWEATLPHESFVNVISDFGEILSRKSNADKTGLWIEGAYGTGKSRLIWTLQNLLECSAEEFKKYFAKYELLRDKTNLRDKILNAKSGKLVTAYRYGSGEITSTKRLINAVFDSVTDSLKKCRYNFKGENTLRGRIIDWLEKDNANRDFFYKKIQSAKYQGKFGNSSVDDILNQLKNPAQSTDELIDNILTLGEAEGIRAFEMGVDDLKKWLTEVIVDNNLTAVVFFWDEFSDFFKHNKNNLSDFQKLAELSNSQPFYFVIATHESSSYAAGDKDFTKLKDRFFHREITMPDNIAFELIRHALKINPAKETEWKDDIHPALVNRTNKSRVAVANFVKIGGNVLEEILPIHPLAALSLKYISEYFASNQRSMFNFIKSDKANIDSFQKFIEIGSPFSDNKFLTIDYLWAFLYDKCIGQTRRSNLDEVIVSILETLNKNPLSDQQEEAVLKTVLIMEAITRKTGEAIELLKPTEDNLKLAFEGVDIKPKWSIKKFAEGLVRKGILSKKPGAKEIFTAVAVATNQKELNKARQDIENNFRLSQIIEDTQLIKEIEKYLSPAQRVRFEFEAATSDNFGAKLYANKTKSYKIRGVVCFAKDAADQKDFKTKIDATSKNPAYKDLAIIDMTDIYFDDNDRFKHYIDYKANALYWRGKDDNLAKQNLSEAERVCKEWINALVNSNLNKHKAQLDRKTLAIYPLSFDNIKIEEPLFGQKISQKDAEAGINEKADFSFKQDNINNLVGNAWQYGEDYWSAYPQLTISKLKAELDAFIDSEIKISDRVSFSDIFKFLVEKGFMPCRVHTFLTGFLLKEYANDSYCYSTGSNAGDSLNGNNLAKYIVEAINQFTKPSRKYQETYIELMPVQPVTPPVEIITPPVETITPPVQPTTPPVQPTTPPADNVEEIRKVKITVIKKARYDDLIALYENPLENPCDMKEEQIFISSGGQRPENFCKEAWKTLEPFVLELARGGGNFYGNWMRNPKSALLSCNDGFRPVSFLIETI